MLPILLLLAATAANASELNEIGLTLGRVHSSTASVPGGKLDLRAGGALQANYGRRLHSWRHASLYGDVHFLASPLREIRSPLGAASRDFASLYLTPGARLKFAPQRRVSPWISAGGGYALYENSRDRLDGRPSTLPRLQHGGAFVFGGGADVRLWRFVSARFEARDFVTGSPGLIPGAAGGARHNVITGGGFVLRFGE